MLIRVRSLDVEAAAVRRRRNLTGGLAAVTPLDLGGEVTSGRARIRVGDVRDDRRELATRGRADVASLRADRRVADGRGEVHDPVGRAVRRVGDAALVRPLLRVGVAALDAGWVAGLEFAGRCRRTVTPIDRRALERAVLEVHHPLRERGALRRGDVHAACGGRR